jgi:hypothetical protein
MTGEQERMAAGYYLHNGNRNPSKIRRHRIREEFNSRKHKLKQEWSRYYSFSWPVENYKGGIRPFEAHHIIPINSGGLNKWWNIAPLSNENHKELHSSTEEHACFSHDIVEQKICRLILKIRETCRVFLRKIEFSQRNDQLALSNKKIR